MKGKNHKNVACKNSIIYKNLPIPIINLPIMVIMVITIPQHFSHAYPDEVRFT